MFKIIIIIIIISGVVRGPPQIRKTLWKFQGFSRYFPGSQEKGQPNLPYSKFQVSHSAAIKSNSSFLHSSLP